MKRKVINGVLMVALIIGSSFILVSCKEVENLNKTPWVEKVLFDENDKKEKLDFIATTKPIAIKDIMYENGVLKFKTYVIKLENNKLEKEMQVINFGGTHTSLESVHHLKYGDMGYYFKVGTDEYILQSGAQSSEVLENGRVKFKGNDGTESVYDVVALDIQVLKDGTLKVINEEQAIYSKDIQNYENMYNIFDYINNSSHIGMKENKVKREDVIKDKDSSNVYVASEKVLGSEGYFKVITYEWSGILHNETKELLKIKDMDSIDVKNIFMDEGEIFAIDKKGNLIELIKNGEFLEVKNSYENIIKINNDKIVGKYILIHKDKGHAYVIYKGEELVDNEVKESRNILYNFNLDTKEMNVIGGSDDKSKNMFFLEGSGNGYILFRKSMEDKKLTLGKVKGNKVNIIAEGLDYIEGDTIWSYGNEDYFIILKNKENETKIEVYNGN